MTAPETPPDTPTGNIKVTRQDWLRAALARLVDGGEEQVRIMPMADELGVSRSSFYWYFRDRQEILDALLDHWQSKNTAGLLAQAAAPAETITAAVCNVHRCVVNPALFDTALDFAMRDWARRAPRVAEVLKQSDARRVAALRSMFLRFDYGEDEAETRAFVLYYMQLGYDLAQLNEPVEARLARIPEYLFVFTGRRPQDAEVAEFTAYARRFLPPGA